MGYAKLVPEEFEWITRPHGSEGAELLDSAV
jgi:hypothetical protein